MDVLIQRFTEKYARTQIKTMREFEQDIDWDNQLIGITGARGVGKTTLLLQHLKKGYLLNDAVLYTSLDHLYFIDNKLYDFAESFYQKGGKLLVLDEVHRYPNWSVELKNIYDDFPELKVVFTGSSLLELKKGKADLSRRAVMYKMAGLSFREFIKFESGIDFPRMELVDLLENHRLISGNICSKIKPLSYFTSYLKYGYYPFYLENKKSFLSKLEQSIQQILDVDIPQFEQIQTSNIVLLKRLLQIIVGSVTFKPNYTAISQKSGISLNTMKNYIGYLSDAELLLRLYPKSKGLNNLGKPEKMYLQNTNLIYALTGSQADVGYLRETFFYNQLSQVHRVSAAPESDFMVDGKYTFEIGGKNKKKSQIQDVDRAFLVMDDIETGFDNVLPLWLFGFLY
ncbi:ATP-binding protein [Roseimarinus sediminis]|uniref:ATP-binding protein n=1 Tax=Roseimarinus sediminis TaxID=1610899 RepID=UPI003D1FD4F1